jgi:hypothetical protein
LEAACLQPRAVIVREKFPEKYLAPLFQNFELTHQLEHLIALGDFFIR